MTLESPGRTPSPLGSTPPRVRTSLLNELASAPAIIAILIAGTICYLAITRVDIPDILGNGLLTILGFYFGTQVPTSKKLASE